MKEKIKKIFLNIIFPEKCFACGIYGDGYCCKNCFKRLERLSEKRCKICNIEIPINYNDICRECTLNKPYFSSVFSFGKYSGDLKKLIILYKYKSKRVLKDVLKNCLIEVFDKNKILLSAKIVIPVPMTAKKKIKRGFNHAQDLGLMISELFNINYSDTLLTRITERSPQNILSQKDRINNVKGNFCLSGKDIMLPSDIILIDDVITTGSTADECSKLLNPHRNKNIYVVSIARSLLK